MTDHGYLEVVNWTELQHYKDRDPLWIKLYRRLQDKYEWLRLPDASKGQLVGIWILASKHDNRVPADPEYIAQRIGATGPVDIEALITAGFVSRLRRASDLPAERQPLALPETEVETETKKNTTSSASRANDEVTDGQIMAAIRQHLYAPDGRPPEGWVESREFTIMRQLRKHGKSGAQILRVVEGLGILAREGKVKWLKGKTTLRAVFHTQTGCLDMWGQAEDAYYAEGGTVIANIGGDA